MLILNNLPGFTLLTDYIISPLNGRPFFFADSVLCFVHTNKALTAPAGLSHDLLSIFAEGVVGGGQVCTASCGLSLFCARFSGFIMLRLATIGADQNLEWYFPGRCPSALCCYWSLAFILFFCFMQLHHLARCLTNYVC